VAIKRNSRQEQLVRAFLTRGRRRGLTKDVLPSERGGRGGPPRFPRGASPTPSEDDALFNPLVHGNRKMGARNKGPVKRGR